MRLSDVLGPAPLHWQVAGNQRWLVENVQSESGWLLAHTRTKSRPTLARQALFPHLAFPGGAARVWARCLGLPECRKLLSSTWVFGNGISSQLRAGARGG